MSLPRSLTFIISLILISLVIGCTNAQPSNQPIEEDLPVPGVVSDTLDKPHETTSLLDLIKEAVENKYAISLNNIQLDSVVRDHDLVLASFPVNDNEESFTGLISANESEDSVRLISVDLFPVSKELPFTMVRTFVKPSDSSEERAVIVGHINDHSMDSLYIHSPPDLEVIEITKQVHTYLSLFKDDKFPEQVQGKKGDEIIHEY